MKKSLVRFSKDKNEAMSHITNRKFDANYIATEQKWWGSESDTVKQIR